MAIKSNLQLIKEPIKVFYDSIIINTAKGTVSFYFEKERLLTMEIPNYKLGDPIAVDKLLGSIELQVVQ